MPVAELDVDGRINIDTEYRDRELIKLVPGAKWDNDRRTWWAPLSWATCAQLRGVFGSELQVGAELGAWAKSEIAERIQPCLALRTAEDAEGLNFLSALRPFQRAGAAFLARAGQALIADEMGLGKTVQTIAALEVLGDAAYPVLVVCPNSMKLTWSEEFSRWAPGRFVQVVHGGAAARRKQIEAVQNGEAEVAVINYESLRMHTRLAPYGSVNLADDEKLPKELNAVGFKTVVADEAHRAKDPRAKQTRALWWMGDTATHRYALTGTPVANSPEDIWTLMRFVSRAEFPAKTKFIERYALQSWDVFGFMEVVGIRPEAQQELFSIIDPRMIRRLKQNVLPQLPEKTYATRWVEMVPKQKKAYDQIRKEMLAELDTGTLLTTSPLTRLTRLMQFASAYGELVANGKLDEQTQQPLFDLKLIDPSCKVDALEEIVAELGDQQAVVFAESRQLIELAAARLAKAGYKIGQVTGTVPAPERQANVSAFQKGDLKVLLLTLGAGGEGLTLTAASTAIFLQRSFNAVRNAQAEDRIHRMGQDAERVMIIDVIAADTVESRVRDVLLSKADKLEEIVRDKETVKAWLAK